MGRIRVLSDHIANKIAAGEVVERPASVVKELLENALDAGASRVRIEIEGGGKKLIAIEDDGQGMVRDDALLAFERHATSKIHDVDDLEKIATLGFRGEALPSIASVSRLTLETHAASEGDASGTRIEIAGGKLLKVEEAGVPVGTSIRVHDLFFNVPARRKFLKAEQTELSHIAALVTQYALVYPQKSFELQTATQVLISSPPVSSHEERIYQIFGRDTLVQMVAVTAELPFDRAGLPEPPPWRRAADYKPPTLGAMRLSGFASKPELQKLNRNSIYVCVNQRMIRDRLIQHAIAEAYRNILPNGLFPVVMLFLEMPPWEVDCNVHPAKTEVRFRQQQIVHDFVRDSIRSALLAARPIPEFTREISAQPTASAFANAPSQPQTLVLEAPVQPAYNQRIEFTSAMQINANAALNAIALPEENARMQPSQMPDPCSNDVIVPAQAPQDLSPFAGLRPLAQVRDSFIVAANNEGLWIIDQHTAHERVLFEKIMREREGSLIEGQCLLMPLIIELTPSQWPVFAEIADELRQNGFEAEPFGTRTIAVKSAPTGIKANDIERLLAELIDQIERDEQATNLKRIGNRIAATVACHAAVKVNMPLEMPKMEWLLEELAKTDAPMTCPHGRPVMLRHSVQDIQKAFKRTWGEFK